jgi:alkaline phosphatase D
MNINQFKESLPFIRETGVAVLVWGHHGVGKSQAVRQYCDENQLGFVDLRLGTQDVGDLLGLADFKVNERGEKVATKFMQPTWFPTDPESQGVIFLDEINRGRRDVLQAVFQLVLDKRLHEYKLPKGWSVIAAANPSTQDYVVTDISDRAFLDRFCQIKLAPSKTEWLSYAKKKGFDPSIVQFISEQPAMLQGELEAYDLGVTPSRRSWEAVDKLMKAKLPVHLRRDLICGLVGTTAGTAYLKSLESEDKPITAREVVENFENVKARIKKYSNAKTGGRIDMLKYTSDSILELAQQYTQNGKQFEASEKDNLGQFLLAIPKDLAFALCRELYMEESARKVIEESKELLKLFADARKLEIEGIN